MTSSFTIGPATAADYPAFLRLFPELAVPEAPPAEESFAAGIAPDAWMARAGGEAIGYVWARPRGERMHIVHLITDPSFRRRGVARALLGTVRQRTRAAGLARWMLHVKPANRPARALYEGEGMQTVMESASFRVPWAAAATLPVVPGTSSAVVKSHEDEVFERALGLAPREIAALRTLSGRVVMGARAGTEPSGVAVFDPSFPGTSVFRVTEPRFARALLDGLRAYALPEHQHLLTFVEGDPPLAELLRSIGGEEIMRVLQLEGAV